MISTTNEVIVAFSIGIIVGMGAVARAYKKEMQNDRRSLVESARLVQYLAEMIDKNDVPITEFDAIAIKTLVENVRHPS